jgi:hypothetical protein
MRSFAIAVASAALVFGCLFAAPASATTTTVTAATQPIVAWSQTTTGSLTLVPNYTANGVTNPTGIATIVSGTANGYSGSVAAGGESCNPTISQSGTFINFGIVYEPIGSNVTACDYQNALLAIVTTNDTNWTVTQQLQIATSTYFTLCALFPQASVQTSLPLTTSNITGGANSNLKYNIDESACYTTGYAQEPIGTQNVTPTAQTLIPYQGAAGTFYQGEDVLLLVTGPATPTSYSVTMNVTLTLN